MPRRMGYGLMAATGLLWIIATVGLASIIGNILNASTTVGIIIVSPIMGFLYHHIRNWIASKSDSKQIDSPLGMTIAFPILILILYLTM